MREALASGKAERSKLSATADELRSSLDATSAQVGWGKGQACQTS